MKKRSKVISLIVCMFAALFCFGAVAFANADSPILVTDYPSEFKNGITTVGFHFNQQAGVNDMTNLEGKTMSGKVVKEYFYYNEAPIDTGVINLHWLSYGLAVTKNGDAFKVGDTMELKKGFPIPNADVTSDHEVGESVKLVYTTSGWIRTAETDSTEKTDLTVELANGAGNGQTFNISGYSVKRARNYTSIENWSDLGHSLSEFILLNGEKLKDEFDVHMMSGNLYVYPNSGFSFQTGDTITLKKGMHLPGELDQDYWGSKPDTDKMIFTDYLGADFTIKLGVSGWAVSQAAGATNSLSDVSVIEEVLAGATMPATYDFNLNFKLEIAESELNGLQDQDQYSTLIKVGDKTVKEWNAQFADLKNEDGENIPAISLSAYGTGLKFSIVQSTNIIDFTKSINVTIGKDFVSETGHILKEDIVRYYIVNYKYWSSVAPTKIEKTDVNEIVDYTFKLGDNGANGWFLLTFREAISDSTYIEYGSSPRRQKSAIGYSEEKVDYLASTGITYNLLTHVEINGKTLYERYGEDRYTANGPVWQIHVNADGEKKLRIAAAANTGFNTDNDQTFVLKAGLMFVNGTYLAEDVVLKYTATGESLVIVPNEIAVTGITLDKTSATITCGDFVEFVATVTPDNATDRTVTWSSSDPSIATVDANGKVTAVKEGTVTITATCGDQQAEATVTVSASIVSVTSVTLNKTQSEIEVGKTDTLTATVKPDDATDKTVTWTSSDASIAMVDGNGKVTAVKEGTVTITATCGDRTATCEITVKAQSSGGCNGFAGFSAGLAGLVLASVAFVLIRKRKIG